ncbi:unnamed protein product [Alopecurus aequalis]
MIDVFRVLEILCGHELVSDNDAECKGGGGSRDHLPPVPFRSFFLCLRLPRRHLFRLVHPRQRHVGRADQHLRHGEAEHAAVEPCGYPVDVGRRRQLERLVDPHMSGGALAAEGQPATGVHEHLELVLLEPFNARKLIQAETCT